MGPRPYERQDRHNFFGWAREARDMLALVKAERAVLFYAQSGAGKTSLLNAQIIPALEEEGFHVLPVARVGSDAPPGIKVKSVSNIFVFSALMGLAGKDAPAETLLHHTLLSFLREAVQTSEVSQDLEGLGAQRKRHPSAPCFHLAQAGPPDRRGPVESARVIPAKAEQVDTQPPAGRPSCGRLFSHQCERRANLLAIVRSASVRK